MANFWQQFENTIFWGNGPRKIGGVLSGTLDSDVVTPLVIEGADGHVLYLNVANTWNGADEGVTANGTIVIKYTIMS